MSDVKNYAVIDTNQDPQVVINCVSWDGESDYDFHAGHGVDDGLIIVQSDTVGKGWTYADGVFSPPVVVDQQEGE